MQKSEVQDRKAHQGQTAVRQGGGAVIESPQAEHISQLEAMADNSPQVSGLARLAAMANNTLQSKVAQRVEAPGQKVSAVLSGNQQVRQLQGGLDLAVTGKAMQNPLAKFLPVDDRRTQVLNDTLTGAHQKALQKVGSQYLFAIRETGAGSIKRLNEGAKPKPHTILEKSIKKDSVDAAYGSQAADILKKVSALDLDGFVGHWRMEEKDDGKGGKKTVPVELLGVRVDNYQGGKPDFDKLVDDCASGEYIPVNLAVSQGGDHLIRFKELHPGNEWKKHLYTGDYDLHEVYDNENHQIAEGAEKARMVSILNACIAQTDPARSGGAHVDQHHRTHVDSQYAMFQHGDQATYVANQHNEARQQAGGGAAAGPTVASVVAGVSRQSTEPMVWQYKGAYYVTLNIEEHKAFRSAVGLVVSQEFASNAISEARRGGGFIASEDSHAQKHRQGDASAPTVSSQARAN